MLKKAYVLAVAAKPKPQVVESKDTAKEVVPAATVTAFNAI